MRYFEISFNDLSADKQEELIEDVKTDKIEKLKDEAVTDFLKRPEHEGRTWQEAACREYSIDWELWTTEEAVKEFNWAYAIDQKCEQEAEDDLYNAFHHLEVEVEV